MHKVKAAWPAQSKRKNPPENITLSSITPRRRKSSENLKRVSPNLAPSAKKNLLKRRSKSYDMSKDKSRIFMSNEKAYTRARKNKVTKRNKVRTKKE